LLNPKKEISQKSETELEKVIYPQTLKSREANFLLIMHEHLFVFQKV
jgi:hypothetical protein